MNDDDDGDIHLFIGINPPPVIFLRDSNGDYLRDSEGNYLGVMV